MKVLASLVLAVSLLASVQVNAGGEGGDTPSGLRERAADSISSAKDNQNSAISDFNIANYFVSNWWLDASEHLIDRSNENLRTAAQDLLKLIDLNQDPSDLVDQMKYLKDRNDMMTGLITGMRGQGGFLPKNPGTPPPPKQNPSEEMSE